jgi:ubiquinone/menaquinone biosynthesis C-methylase UbiE
MHAHATMFGLFNNAALYDRLTRVFGFRRLYQRTVTDVEKASLPDGARVLDVGTGPGRIPIELARRCPRLQLDGIDLSEAMIVHARRSAGARAGRDARVTFTVGDVARLPYPDDAFDLIVSTMSQHHWADVSGGMRELRRVLREGGHVWIYDTRLSMSKAESAARAAFPGHAIRRTRVSPLIDRLEALPAVGGPAQPN